MITQGCADENVYNQYESFFRFAIDHRSETFSEFVADPFYLYFIDSTDNNAYACRQSNGINVIGIGKNLFESIIERTLNAAPLFQSATKLTAGNLAQILTVPIDYYIFLFARHFLFYHELAHLMQFKHADGAFLFENRNLAGSDNFSEISHILERDADVIGSNLAADQLLNHYRTLPSEIQTSDNLEILVALAVVGVYFLFDLLSDGISNPIYFAEKTHPHTAVRINFALRAIANKVGILHNWKEENIISTTQKFLDIIASVTNGESRDRFLWTMVSEQHQILDYELYMHNEMRKLDWLASSKLIKKVGEIIKT